MFESTERPSTEGIGTFIGTRDGLFLRRHYGGHSIHEKSRNGGWEGVGWNGGVVVREVSGRW